MKKLTILLSLVIIIALLAACSSSLNQASTVNQSEAESSLDTAQQDSNSEKNLVIPLQTALIIGTFELEATENEITAEQAAELLPLWMVLKNLLESDTAAMDEITALTNQISDTMTEAQMAYIKDLELDPQSQRSLMTELGLTEGFERPENAEGEESQRGANRPEGMPEGMGPGGGQGGGEGLTPEQMESMQATREAGGGMTGRMGMMSNTTLIDALIELLQSK